MLSRPGGKTSDIFGLAPADAPAVQQKAQLPAPGGPALNIFDNAPVAVATDANRRDPNKTTSEEIQHRMSRHYTGESNKSHFSIGLVVESAPAAHEVHTGRRQLSQSVHTSFSFSDGSQESLSAPASRSGRSQVEDVTPAAHEVHTGRRQLGQSVHTSFSFSDGSQESVSAPASRSGRRDPNAQSQEAVQRPSSRVLSRPGGKQNFTFA